MKSEWLATTRPERPTIHTQQLRIARLCDRYIEKNRHLAWLIRKRNGGFAGEALADVLAETVGKTAGASESGV